MTRIHPPETKEYSEYKEVQQSKENTMPSDPSEPRLRDIYSPIRIKKKRGSKLKIVAPIMGKRISHFIFQPPQFLN